MPPAPGRQCNRCSAGRVHWAEDRLCTACHEPADEEGFRHLYDKRIGAARFLLGNLEQAEAGGIAAMLRTYHPEAGQCLCQRDGCLISLLGREGKHKPICQGPGDNKPCKGRGGRNVKRRTYVVAGDDECGDAGTSARGSAVLCQVCYEQRRRDRRKSQSTLAPGDGGSGLAEAPISSQAPAGGGADVVGASTQRQGTGGGASTSEGSGLPTAKARVRKVKAASIVRSRVERSVGGGEIVYWKDVAEWLRAERLRLGEDKLEDGSVREKVKQMFDSIVARSRGCNAIVVDIRGNRVAGGDGREKALCLFPKDIRDEVVVGYLVRMRNAEGTTLKSELGRVATDPTEPPDPVFAEERMEVVKTAGEIVRRDI